MTTSLFHEVYRPLFHFTPRVNWINDPNGLVYYKGEYHLFYQYNPSVEPSGPEGGYKIWGHAVGPDLAHWEILPHAILPDRLGSIWSGSGVVDWENTTGFQKGAEKPIVVIYTAAGGTSPESQGQPFTQCIAYSTDRGRTWTKYAGNPVLGHVVGENRDPKLVWYAPQRKWVMALYKEGNTYTFFSSPDLKAWTHLHDLEVPGCAECPDFFPMRVEGDPSAPQDGQEHWVFTGANGHYLIGSFDGMRFTPEVGPLQVDFGANYYAVQTYSDAPNGRRIQIAWMAGGKYPGMPFNQQLSFPCDMTLRRLDAGLRLCRQPVPEIATLHAEEHSFSHIQMQPGENPLADVQGELFDIRAELEVGTDGVFDFTLRGETVSYSAAAGQMVVMGKVAPVQPVDGRIRVHILVDRTSIEVFVNEGHVGFTSCCLPDPANRSLALNASSAVSVRSMKVYPLRSAWVKTEK
jgi:sucrose-6-phosphate hydrolase SacC (GH32 family)